MSNEFLMLCVMGFIMLAYSIFKNAEISTKNLCLQRVNKELQQRIDKAIEYINKFKVPHDIDGDIAYLDEFHILASPKALLEILKGTSE